MFDPPGNSESKPPLPFHKRVDGHASDWGQVLTVFDPNLHFARFRPGRHGTCGHSQAESSAGEGRGRHRHPCVPLTVGRLRQEPHGDPHPSSAILKRRRRRWRRRLSRGLKGPTQVSVGGGASGGSDRLSDPTLACSAYSPILVLPKSHSDRSTSASPRKLFRPNVSWCHTDTFSS